MKRFLGAAAALAVLIGATFGIGAQAATAPNTSAAGAVSYGVGQGWMSQYVDETTPQRWIRFGTVGGRSYCVESVLGSDTYVRMLPTLRIYSDLAGATQIGLSSSALGEPYNPSGARYCFVDSGAAAVGQERLAKIEVPIASGSGDNGYVRFRVVDTSISGGSLMVGNISISEPYQCIRALNRSQTVPVSFTFTRFSRTGNLPNAWKSSTVSVPAGQEVLLYCGGYYSGEPVEVVSVFTVGVNSTLAPVRVFLEKTSAYTTVASEQLLPSW